MADLTHGVDVHPIYQSPVDWAKVAGQVEFCYVKLTEGHDLLSWQNDGLNESHAYITASRTGMPALMASARRAPYRIIVR